VNQDIRPAPERPVNVVAYPFEVGLQVGAASVEDVDAVAVQSVFFGGGEPGDVEDLDEVGDAVLAEEFAVVDCSHRADEEGARPRRGRGRRGGREDEVHGGAHCLHDLGREIVEANHRSGG